VYRDLKDYESALADVRAVQDLEPDHPALATLRQEIDDLAPASHHKS
jgi:regulator of sirC expression with transglutaminase-like and TPR domain